MYDVARVDGSERQPTDAANVKAAANAAKTHAMAPGNTGRWVVLVRGTNQVAAVVWPDGGADFQALPYPTL